MSLSITIEKLLPYKIRGSMVTQEFSALKAISLEERERESFNGFVAGRSALPGDARDRTASYLNYPRT